MGCCVGLPTRQVQKTEVNVRISCDGGEEVQHDYAAIGGGSIESVTLCTLVRSNSAPLDLVLAFGDTTFTAQTSGAFVTARMPLYSEPNLAYGLQCGLVPGDTIESLRERATEEDSPVQIDVKLSECTVEDSLQQFERLLPSLGRRTFTLRAPRNTDTWTGSLIVVVVDV